MRTVILLSCLCAITLAVPVVKSAPVPSFIQVEASNPFDHVRKTRQIFDLNYDVYNNNGFGYFNNGDEFYGRGGYGGYEGYGGYGGYGGGYGCYGGFGGYPYFF